MSTKQLEKTQVQLVDLEMSTLDWITARDPDRTIRLIHGGPGSGKSSFARRIAAVLADRPEIKPVCIPL